MNCYVLAQRVVDESTIEELLEYAEFFRRTDKADEFERHIVSRRVVRIGPELVQRPGAVPAIVAQIFARALLRLSHEQKEVSKAV